MLINCVKEDDDEKVKGEEILDVDDNLDEYHTANELFEIMTKNHMHNFDILENKSLTTRDLVILYENIDPGAKVIANRGVCNSKAPNQYVETVIYDGDVDSEDSEDTDVCAIYSKEDLRNVFSINNERIDLINMIPSFDNTLCHKFDNIRMKTSDYSTEYENHFLFNNCYIKEHLQSFHAMTGSKQSDSAVLPTSLLDYICCKRFDGNGNFYMDNVINYVQNTIEQLKRISNGDYLTDRVKEKWREVEDHTFNHKTDEKDKIIALSPTHNSLLPIVGKTSEVKNTWDEIVHSEVDVRCLTKILKKKIIVEIPKIICGSYGLLEDHFKKNQKMNFKKSGQCVNSQINKQSNIDVLKLLRPDMGLINCNIDSVLVLKTSTTSISRKESSESTIVAINIKEIEYHKEDKPKIVELDDNGNCITEKKFTEKDAIKTDEEIKHEIALYSNDIYDTDTTVSLMSNDELGYAIKQLNIQASVLEENEDCSTKKKKTPNKVRIKSPYENKSHILDERKRKRLLEIREKREKKKLAMNENCKITKHKYVKAQSSNSVTKLSITNKSFYNSIYGQTNIVNKNFRNVFKDQKLDNIPNIDIDEYGDELKMDPSSRSPGKNSLKYINRSYYLDDADTEIMYLQMKPSTNEDDMNEVLTPSTSVLSSDAGGTATGFKSLINPSTTDLSETDTTSSLQQNISLEASSRNTNEKIDQTKTQNTEIIVPTNTPKYEMESNKNDKLKKLTSIDCRKSIGKIYDLMTKITVSPTTLEATRNLKENNKTNGINDNVTSKGDFGVTNIKDQFTSSNPNNFVIENEIPLDETSKKFISKKTDTNVVPKVIISSKLHSERKDTNKTKKETQKAESKIAENPLKAISQLLHEFDNVQKTRNKNGKETKSFKRSDNITVATTNSPRHLTLKRGSCDVKNTKQSERENSRFFKPVSPTKVLKFSPQTTKEDKSIQKKKLADIIDEVKEMRGEAVRGPSKRSRIDNLAQPKKSYTQAHQEDFQNKYSKNFVHRLQKLPTTSLTSPEKCKRTNFRNKQRGIAETSLGTAKQTNKTGVLEKTVKSKRSANSSPVETERHVAKPANTPSDNVNKDSESLKKKMMAVENYLKYHFGRVSPKQNVDDKNPRKSRVPLIPTDIDIASMTSSPLAEESSTLGKKLHNMINSKINTNSMNLNSSPDCKEFILETGKYKNSDSVEQLSKCGTTSTSDHPVDIFEDKNIITAVACLSKEKSCKNEEDRACNVDLTKNKTQDFKPCNELQKLENALNRQLSNGTFHKRLRIKNLTLTPKQSTQRVFLLQSGDTKSLIVKSTISQNVDFYKAEARPKFDILPAIPHKTIQFNLPMQIATVGYVFPVYETFKNCSKDEKSNFKGNNDDFELNVTSKNNDQIDKTVQCYNGRSERKSLKQNTDTKGTEMLDFISQYTKESFDVPEEPMEREKRLPSIPKELCHEIENNKVDESEKIKTKNFENISNSTSLDILVGLLNEIKKITTCQSNFVASKNETDSYLESKELKVILNNSADQDNSTDISIQNSVSITSLDNPIHAHPSNLSLCWKSNIDDCNEKYRFAKNNKLIKDINYDLPLLNNKEVNVKISQKELVHKFTNIPSRLFPVTVNRSADVIRSLIALVNKTSNKSVSTFPDCHLLYSNTTFNNLKDNVCINKSDAVISKPKVKKLQDHVPEQNKSESVLMVSYVKTKSKVNSILQNNVRNERNIDAIQEFDPLIKMKRDVLVTVYSILVFTVFAALTLPEMMLHT